MSEADKLRQTADLLDKQGGYVQDVVVSYEKSLHERDRIHISIEAVAYFGGADQFIDIFKEGINADVDRE